MTVLNRPKIWLHRLLSPIISRIAPVKWKEWNEMYYWKKRKGDEGTLRNTHYKRYYTEFFKIEDEFYKNKSILDIGCGPRGSLEWATMATERIGLDPLAEQYLKMGAHEHKMEYVAANSEAMPFSDNHFDVICSFNSLDHVANLDDTIAEIKRVAKPGGIFLLITDLNHPATATEPQEFSWDVLDNFAPEFTPLLVKQLEKPIDAVYGSLRENIEYDFSDFTPRYGLLAAKMQVVSN